ncbi:MAG: TIGR00341 family protein [Methanomassiliicoccales archaeon]|nr:TIGR00341 family protein [Methanomassiliicoccales archaeon]
MLQGEHVDILPSIRLGDDWVLIRMVMEAEESETIISKVTEAFGILEGFRLSIVTVEATIPEHKPREEVAKARATEEKNASKEAEKVPSMAEPRVQPQVEQRPPAPPAVSEEKPAEVGTQGRKKGKTRSRISVDELQSDLSDSVKLNLTYLALVAHSVGVSAVGLIQNNVAVIIGAMVIAPLLAPNMALSLATTLANGTMAAKALKVLATGVFLALALSFALGVLLDIDPALPEIASRTKVSLGDVAVALSAGAAAAIFVSLGTGVALVGVTVAVALLPPLVVTGLLAGAGEYELAWQSFLLLLINLIGINLAGTAVFVAEGIWPRSWWEGKKAKRTALMALTVWTMLLVTLVLLLLAAQGLVRFDWP